MTIVWVLEHAWDEGGSDIRGIYWSREEAEADLPVEAIEVLTAEHPHCWTRQHDEFCCFISEHRVLDRAARASALAKPPPVPGSPVIPEALIAVFEDFFKKGAPFTHVFRPADADMSPPYTFIERSADATKEDT